MLFCKSEKRGARGAQKLVAPGALLLDVRSAEEFAQSHVAGARNIPVQELQGRLRELDRARPIAVYCRSGRRSALAAELLVRSGFPSVQDLGGLDTTTVTIGNE